MKNNSLPVRDIFQERIKKGLLGPGSDIFVNHSDSKSEIISDYPLQRYYTGAIFPEKERVNSLFEEAENEVANMTDIDAEDDVSQAVKNGITEDYDLDSEEQIFSKKKDAHEDDELKISNSTFFPTNIGLTCCLSKEVRKVKIEFSFGRYLQSEKNIKIAADRTIYETFMNHPSFPFKDLLGYEDGYLLLKRKLEGSSKNRTKDFAELDNFKKREDYFDQPIKYQFHYFEKLIGRTWRREHHHIDLGEIPITDIEKPITIFETSLDKKNEHCIKVAYALKTYRIASNPESIYVKVQLINVSTPQAANQFSNAKERLNKKCLFQAKIKITSPKLKPHKSYLELNPLDEEVEKLNGSSGNFVERRNYIVPSLHKIPLLWKIKKVLFSSSTKITEEPIKLLI
ncbi:MAG: hypothetical protein AAF849_21940 [Bacteroidota bacterium]